MCIFHCETLSLHHGKCHRTLFPAWVPSARFRRRRPHAGGNRACVPGKRLVYARRHLPRRCSRRRQDAPARCAGGVAGALPVPVAEPRRVLVVMAGNIPLVGFFDMLCVLAAGHRCLVKPSAKDTVLMEYVIGLLRGIDPQVPVEFYDGSTSPDAVIATGSDNANRYFRAQYAGIPALLRGNRQSVAVLGGRETPAQLTALADDIWAYSGLGCRSVSLLFLPEGYDLQLRMPEVNVKYRNSYRQQKALPDDGRTAVPRPGSCRGRRRAGLSRGVEPDQLFVLQITRRGRGLARSTRCRTAMRRFGVHCLPPPRGFRPCTVPWADGLPRRQGCHRIPYDILFVN